MNKRRRRSSKTNTLNSNMRNDVKKKSEQFLSVELPTALCCVGTKQMLNQMKKSLLSNERNANKRSFHFSIEKKMRISFLIFFLPRKFQFKQNVNGLKKTDTTTSNWNTKQKHTHTHTHDITRENIGAQQSEKDLYFTIDIDIDIAIFLFQFSI